MSALPIFRRCSPTCKFDHSSPFWAYTGLPSPVGNGKLPRRLARADKRAPQTPGCSRAVVRWLGVIGGGWRCGVGHILGPHAGGTYGKSQNPYIATSRGGERGPGNRYMISVLRQPAPNPVRMRVVLPGKGGGGGGGTLTLFLYIDAQQCLACSSQERWHAHHSYLHPLNLLTRCSARMSYIKWALVRAPHNPPLR